MVDSVLEVQNIKTTGISPQKDIVTTSGTGDVTVNGNLVIPDDGTIGSASATNAVTIDSSGRVLAGKTSADSGATAGLEFDASIDKLYVTRSSGSTSNFNRLSTDGEIIGFAKDGTTVGSIGNTNGGTYGLDINGQGGYLGINTDQTTGGINFYASDYTATPRIQPQNDDAVDLGNGSFRFDDIFATNGTINTSDRNEKQDIEELSETEQRVAVAAKRLLRKYRLKSAVAKKGDKARIHFGIIAQDLKAAFEAEGLDAGRYGMFIHSEWWETEETYTDDNGAEKTRIKNFDTEKEAPESAVKKGRMGIRYPELLAFIIAAI